MTADSQKWQTSFVLNIFAQSLAFWVSVPVTWFIISAHLTYADATRSLAFIVSCYALGEGLGLFVAWKLYGTLSVRQILTVAIIFSIIASLIYGLAGIIAEEEVISSTAFRQLCTARVI